jgi:hypothetical protein
MNFPNFTPTSRSHEAGDFPVKKYRAQDGKEIRILYGSKRTGMKLQLVYANLTDSEAEQFVDHYHEMQGTFQSFALATGQDNMKNGWTGKKESIGAVYWGNAWRYDSAPQMQQVRPGISSVTVNLVAALL